MTNWMACWNPRCPRDGGLIGKARAPGKFATEPYSSLMSCGERTSLWSQGIRRAMTRPSLTGAGRMKPGETRLSMLHIKPRDASGAIARVGDARTLRGGERDQDEAAVLGRRELLRQGLEQQHRRKRDDGAEGEDDDRNAQRPRQEPAVAVGHAGEHGL